MDTKWGNFATSVRSYDSPWSAEEERKLIATALSDLQDALRQALPYGYQFCYLISHEEGSWFELFQVVRTDYNHHWRVMFLTNGDISVEMDDDEAYKSKIANPECFGEIIELIKRNEARDELGK